MEYISHILTHIFRKLHPPKTTRRIEINKQNKNYCDNTIINTKYTWWNYIPLTIIEQFSVRLNQYILLLACLQLWNVIAPIHPAAVWTPLCIILLLGIIKEGADDFNRRLRDWESNHHKVAVIRKGEKLEMNSSKIRVGDLVYLEEGKEIRADLALIGSSSSEGIVYIETSTLDGETDLKVRRVPKELVTLNALELQGIIETGSPNNLIHEFDSTMTFNGQTISISVDQLLPQGCFLRNTDYAYGIAVYTGNETKISKSKEKVRIKVPRNEVFVSNTLFGTIFLQVFFAILLGFLGVGFYFTTQRQQYWYLNPFFQWFEYVVPPLRYFLLMAFLLPPAIKSTRDVSKFFLSWLIGVDKKMSEPDSFKFLVNNISTIEDLGCIDMVFTDKTGTLTKNEMKLIKMATRDKVINLDNFPQDDEIKNLFRNLIMCNTVITKIKNEQIEFQSTSPEEQALVQAVTHYGVLLEHRDLKTIQINLFGQTEKYQIVRVLDFSSERKKMSIILKNEQDKYLILCKGADDRIFSTLHENEDISEARVIVKRFAQEGYRTLCMSSKLIDQEEFLIWEKELFEAEMDVLERKNKVAETYSKMECNLNYLGCTAIEDELQEEVPETIQALREAGIVVYMLTGDKLETAIQIGYNCRLLTNPVIIRQPEDLYYPIQLNEPSLVVEGSTLATILADPQLTRQFKQVSLKCTSIICCRVSPKQKGEVVKLMKQGSEILGTRKRVLAIGDGGNDVSMIRKADIGVGIAGKEGRQAVLVADYAISKFKFLKRLVFVVGRNSYVRLSSVTLATLYKSLMVAMSQAFFAAFCGFSGIAVITTFPVTLFNLVFTATLPFCWITQRDVSEEALLKIPQLYKESKGILNPWMIMTTFLYALYQTCITSLFIYYCAAGPDTFTRGGQTLDFGNFSLLIMSTIMFVQITMPYLLCRSISFFVLIYTGFSIVMFYVCMAAWTQSESNIFDSLFMSFTHNIDNPISYMSVLCAVMFCCFPVLIYRAIEYHLQSKERFLVKYVTTMENTPSGILLDKEERMTIYEDIYSDLISMNQKGTQVELVHAAH